MPKKKKVLSYYEAIGRRKTARARVRLYLAAKGEVEVMGQKVKKGTILINKKPIDQIFNYTGHFEKYNQPLVLTDSVNRFVISAITSGGGLDGQLEAFILAMSRALLLVDETYRPILKKPGLLTADARVRERRKVGTGGKARRKKQSPKR